MRARLLGGVAGTLRERRATRRAHRATCHARHATYRALRATPPLHTLEAIRREHLGSLLRRRATHPAHPATRHAPQATLRLHTFGAMRAGHRGTFPRRHVGPTMRRVRQTPADTSRPIQTTRPTGAATRRVSLATSRAGSNAVKLRSTSS